MPKISLLPVTSTRKTGGAVASVEGKPCAIPQVRHASTGHFRRGRSGNPAGRPIGSANTTHMRLRGLLTDQSEAVVRRVVDAALLGDMTAARIVLDRALPRRACRPPMRLDLPVLKNAADALEALAKIVDGAACGLISSTEATDLSRVVEAFAGILAISEITERIEHLEAQVSEIHK